MNERSVPGLGRKYRQSLGVLRVEAQRMADQRLWC
ncbi:MAG: hypothetical protein US86_C0009G0017 [Candidatus Daviesbacteria bacterium GW2011_GWA2_38_24]|uniref:Uncharacterized protein n=1 Tax=Candidatus Daviesbacteria bacterium GW2011_GWA2_38_24 TaxID=1618422 RepID=A0A0G0LW94_9BACT|nr:MAG: hypothetical protein US86_C0009G0017 [Candidatus Daviesbacteria bacterium GW2011_GWA2_38_24]KKQ80684.1 MAG: hypothetical protein UT01_C0007G0007 [Candidatus Daviesbacteria bacterium GW2011_GWA1_38_7]